MILPKIKRFIKNSFLSWSYRREKYAIIIQRVIRKYIAINRYYCKFGYRYYFLNVFPKAAVMIQKLIRGFLGKLIFDDSDSNDDDDDDGIAVMMMINYDDDYYNDDDDMMIIIIMMI